VLRSSPVDGFRLAYERDGTGPGVVLLHGWPGDHADYREVVPRLRDRADVVVPDLRGFGESDKGAGDYSAQGQARSVLGLIDELGLRAPVIAGYDVGSRVTQTIARMAPERVSAIVVCPPLPGVGERVLGPDAQREFWYQLFHRLELAGELIDGRPEAVRAYLRHFWGHWSGPGFEPSEAELDRLTELYAAPGAFTASIEMYRAGSGTVARALTEKPPPPAQRIAVPTTVLWPEHDPLFPPEWGDRLDEFFSDFSLRRLPGVGHFVPLEAPEEFAHTLMTILPQASPDSR
jgi:pimeloyl-ACP methyl ester carboxylesterase